MNRKEENDKWIQSWKKQLGDYAEPAPDGLWTDLEKELTPDVGARRVVPFYRRYAAVAAVALVVMLSSVSVWWWHASSPDYVAGVAGEPAGMIPPAEEGLMPMAGERIFAPAVAQVRPSSARLAETEPSAVAAAPALMTARLMAVEGETSEETTPVVTEPTQQTERKETVDEKPQPAPRKGYTYDFSSPATRNRARRDDAGRRWGIGISVGNAPIGANSHEGGYKQLSRNGNVMGNAMSDAGVTSNAYGLLLSQNLDNTVQSHTKHRMPVTVGFSVSWHLNDRWALESGLTYTKLSSELWSGTEAGFYESDQKLHYVGIPVKAGYKLWKNKLFAVYMSAGGAVEKCVSGKVNTTYMVDGKAAGSEETDLKVNELQWSVSAAVGAQVKLTRHLGLYVEPGVNYYFNDGAPVETIRKEHPLNFNLQTGLRLSY